jgi:phosphatidylinositol-3-phosphatase
MPVALLRRRIAAAALFGIAIAVQPSMPASAQPAVPALDHVFVIVMENHSFSEIIGSSSAPYINALLTGGGIATNYFAVTHPSLPNYLALTGGSTFGITSDCNTCWISAPNIADRVEAAGKTWKAYEESMPSSCFVGDSYPYVQKHDPFIYYNDIRTNGSRCAGHVVPFTQITSDLTATSTTPNFAFITPNACDDMHDCSIASGDAWLGQHVPQILGSPAFTTQHSLLAITWDEDDFTTINRVTTILVGPDVLPGAQSSIYYNHYSLLRTFENGLGLAALTGNDGGAAPLLDLFASALAGWVRIGGISLSGLGASSWAQSRQDVFLRGQDNGLWQDTWNGSSWLAWTPLGGVITASPAAVSWSSGRIDVFARGEDSGLYHRYWAGSTWAGWEALGGGLDFGPAVASWGNNRLDIFIVGRDSQLWHRYWGGQGWSSWEPLGGMLTSQPAAVSWGSGRVDILARGSDNEMWHLSWSGSAGWTGWQPMGGLFSTGPATTTCASGHLDVVGVGLDHQLWHDGWNGSAWTGWQPIGGIFATDPAAVCPPGTSTVQLFERAPDRSAVQSSVAGN